MPQRRQLKSFQIFELKSLSRRKIAACKTTKGGSAAKAQANATLHEN
jgi:hypothetical protein